MSEAAEILQRFMDEAWNKRGMDAFDRLVAPDVRFHPPREPPKDFAAYRGMAQAFQAGFSDLRFETQHLFSEGDRATARIVITGTNDGAFRGKPATGRKVRVYGHPQCRVRDGRIVEFWQLFDELGMMQQLYPS